MALIRCGGGSVAEPTRLYTCFGNASSSTYSGNVIQNSGSTWELVCDSILTEASGGTNVRQLTISRGAKVKMKLAVTGNGQDYITVNSTTVLTTETTGGLYEYETTLSSGDVITVYQKRTSGSDPAISYFEIFEIA